MSAGEKGINYERILGSAKPDRDEFFALAVAIKATRAGCEFLTKNHLDPDNPNALRGNWVITCEDSSALQKGLYAEKEMVLGDRVRDSREHFRMALKFTALTRDANNFNDFIRTLSDMEKGLGGIFLPDIEIINAGCHVCESYSQFKALWAIIVRLEITPNMKFFNNWLKVCYFSAADVEWVCDRAKEAGYPNLNHESREVFWGLCRGSRRRENCKKLPFAEMLSLRGWILRNRKGDLWKYVVEEAINPIAIDSESCFRGVDSHRFARVDDPTSPPCFGSVCEEKYRGERRRRRKTPPAPEVTIRGKGSVPGFVPDRS